MVIEHNLDVIKTADYIDMGPEEGQRRKIITEGKRRNSKVNNSYMQFLNLF